MGANDTDARVIAARSELATALQAIDDRLNVPKRLRRLGGTLKASMTRHPALWSAGAVVAALAIAGAIVWASTRDD